ncbi:hypothetical protein CRG98_002611, partial [Punica granatum]
MGPKDMYGPGPLCVPMGLVGPIAVPSLSPNADSATSSFSPWELRYSYQYHLTIALPSFSFSSKNFSLLSGSSPLIAAAASPE